jgi:predicted DsbA family dithiol-disulfide isomerase
VSYVEFPLHPETPREGVLLRDLFAGRPVNLEAMAERMKNLMEAEGLPYASRDRLLDSRLAQELDKWGEREGKPAIHDALFRAYFAEGVDIADISSLVRVAEGVGLPAEEARRVLEERTMQGAVDEDWARARALGITGVPTFVAGGRGVVGAQPYEVLERLVTSAGAKRRA